MTTECHEKSCLRHSIQTSPDDGPFCDEPECKKTLLPGWMQDYLNRELGSAVQTEWTTCYNHSINHALTQAFGINHKPGSTFMWYPYTFKYDHADHRWLVK